jgi:hypothetical protein
VNTFGSSYFNLLIFLPMIRGTLEFFAPGAEAQREKERKKRDTLRLTDREYDEWLTTCVGLSLLGALLALVNSRLEDVELDRFLVFSLFILLAAVCGVAKSR